MWKPIHEYQAAFAQAGDDGRGLAEVFGEVIADLIEVRLDFERLDGESDDRLLTLKATRAQRDYWRAKDALRRAEHAMLCTSKTDAAKNQAAWERARKRVRALRAQLRAAGVKP